MKVETQNTITNTVDNGELSLEDLEWISGGQREEDDAAGDDDAEDDEPPV